MQVEPVAQTVGPLENGFSQSNINVSPYHSREASATALTVLALSSSRGSDRGGRLNRDRGDWRAGAAGGGRAAEGRAEGSELDVGECDLGVGAGGLDDRGRAGGGRAVTTGNTGRSRVRGGRVVGVEPEHLGRVVVPERHDEGHAGLKGVAHDLETSELLEAVGVAEGRLLSIAEVVGDGVVASDSLNGGGRGLEDDTVLDEDAADLSEVASGRVVRGQELSDDCDRLGGVDCEARAEERFRAHAEGVEVASILVAETILALVTVTALGVAFAASLARDGADVRGDCSTHGVGFPNIHFVTAGSELTSAGVRVVGRRGPAHTVSLYD